MKALAASIGSQEPVYVQVEQPRLTEANQVRCRTVELGVCGTDRDILRSAQPCVPPNDDFLILGHECLAQVIETNSSVELKEGDWIVPLVRRPNPGFTDRPDRLAPGQYHERGIFASHGFACSEFVDQSEYLLKVPDDVLSTAVLTEPISITEKAIHEAALITQGRLQLDSPEEYSPRVLITGQGPIAFCGILSCLSRGWSCAMVGREPASGPRAQVAQKLGSDYFAWSELEQTTLDYNEAAEADGFDLILECTGACRPMLTAATWLRRLGVCCWLGASWVPDFESLPLDALLRDSILRNQVFFGSVNAARRDYESAWDVLRWYQTNDGPTIITRRVTWEEAIPEFSSRNRSDIKTIVEFN